MQALLNYLMFILGIWNAIVFLIYAFDKYKAKHQLWRISEKTLLIVTFCFGGIGGLLAIYIFHHKIRKGIFIATAILSCLMITILIGYITANLTYIP